MSNRSELVSFFHLGLTTFLWPFLYRNIWETITEAELFWIFLFRSTLSNKLSIFGSKLVSLFHLGWTTFLTGLLYRNKWEKITQAELFWIFYFESTCVMGKGWSPVELGFDLQIVYFWIRFGQILLFGVNNLFVTLSL